MLGGKLVCGVAALAGNSRRCRWRPKGMSLGPWGTLPLGAKLSADKRGWPSVWEVIVRARVQVPWPPPLADRFHRER